MVQELVSPTWGFIGLGQMGYAMARSLRENMPKSTTLLISDVNSQVLDRFICETSQPATSTVSDARMPTVQIAGDVRELAERSTVIITCLPSPQIVKSVFESIISNGRLPTLHQRRMFIDASTIDPTTSRGIAKAVRSKLDADFIDAPVSGGVVAARAGKLSIMFGASMKSEKLIEQVRSVLMLMGTKICHVGPQGAGVAGKLANNYILAVNNIATAEAMNMGRHWGIDLTVLTELINSSTGRCWPTAVNNPVPGVIKDSPASRDYEAGGSVGVIQKDLRLAMAGAQEAGVELALAETADDVYTAVEASYSGKDLSVVYKWMQEGHQLRSRRGCSSGK